MKRNYSLLSAAALAFAGQQAFGDAGVSNFAAPRAWRPRKTYTPNGERECARRRRQIAAGILKVTG